MFPKNTMSTSVAEKPPLQTQKDSTVLYVVDGDQVDAGNNSRGQIKRAKICACTVVMITLIVVAGTLGAITIVLRSQQGTSEAGTVFKEPLLSNNSPPKEPIEETPMIKIDNGGLWPPINPVTPDLVAIEGQATISLSTSPKPVSDGINIDFEGGTTFEPVKSSFSDESSSSPESSSSERMYDGRTWISSSFPYDGFYMRGESGDPPPSHSEDFTPDLSQGSGDMDSDLEGSTESDISSYSSSDSDISSPSSDSSSFSDPYIVSE